MRKMAGLVLASAVLVGSGWVEVDAQAKVKKHKTTHKPAPSKKTSKKVVVVKTTKPTIKPLPGPKVKKVDTGECLAPTTTTPTPKYPGDSYPGYSNGITIKIPRPLR